MGGLGAAGLAVDRVAAASAARRRGANLDAAGPRTAGRRAGRPVPPHAEEFVECWRFGGWVPRAPLMTTRSATVIPFRLCRPGRCLVRMDLLEVFT